MPSSSVGKVFGHQWLSRWLKFRRSLAQTGKWKDSHPAVAEHDCPEVNSSQRWCLCKKNAHVVWSHGDLGSLGQTVHTHRASVYQAAKLAAALLGVARVTAGLAESKSSASEVTTLWRYTNLLIIIIIINGNRRVYDSRHLQADCQEPGSAPEPIYAQQSSMG